MDDEDQGELFKRPEPPAPEPQGKAKGGHARAEKLTAERKAEIAKKAALARWSAPAPADAGEARPMGVVSYVPEGGEAISLGFDGDRQAIWATQADIAALFGVSVAAVSRHIRNIFDQGELEEGSNLQKVQIARSTKPVAAYSLDVVISVGYRVNSRTATRFRQWATQTLTAYVEQGYVLNDKVLLEYPEKLNKLAAEVRALRSSEKHIYAKVRECFKVSASDYDPNSQAVRSFYALLQDKFHHAVTRMTSSKLIMDRASHLEENMGLQSFAGETPTKGEVAVGKNYLRSEELYRLHLLCEQFLLFAESTALTERKMTMESLRDQLDRLLKLNNYPVLGGYQDTDFLRDEAVKHAERELRLFTIKKKLDAAGTAYDPDDLEYGRFDHLLDKNERKQIGRTMYEDDDYS